jgi:tetratricopeptide (TPR) repeat protein
LNDDDSVRNILCKVILSILLLLGATIGIAQETTPLVNSAGSAEALIADGRRLLQDKKYGEALRNFEKVLSKDGSNAEALYYAGTIYIIQNNTQKGLEYLERSVALEPNNVRLSFILAQTYENLSLTDKAIDMYQRIKKLSPDSREAQESDRHARILLGKKFGAQHNYERALQEFSSVLKEYPDDIPALMNKGLTLTLMGRLDEAQSTLEKALTIQPRIGLIHAYLAEVFERKGDIVKSKEQYELVLKLIAPDSPLARTARIKVALANGAELLAKGQLEDARQEFEKVLAIDPGNPVARFNMAAVYHGLGDTQDAQDVLQSLIEENPNNLDVRLRLGTLYLELGRLNDAIHEFEDVIKRGKETTQAQQAAGLLDNIRSKQKNNLARDLMPEERVALYKSLVQENPDDRKVWLELGLLYGQLRRLDEERDAFENVVRLDPNDARAFAVLGGLYEDAGMPDKAINAYKRALNLEKDPAQKQNLMRQLATVNAKVDFSSGKFQEAEQQFKAALAKDQDNYIAHFYLALIYSRYEKLEKAIPEYQEVLRIVPGHISARLNLAIAYEQSGREEDAIIQYQIIARAGVAGLSDTAKKRLVALQKQVGGFSYTMSYALNFDSNTSYSPTNPVQELLSNTSGSVIYRRKVANKRIYWGLSFSPSYTVYHQQQFDFLQLDVNPFVRTTWRGTDFSGNYSYSQTDSVLVKRNYNKSNSIYMDAVRRFKMRSLLPFLTAKEQRRSTPSQLRINGNYRTFQADTAPTYDSNTYSLGALLNQGSSSGWSWAVNYNYSNNQNVHPIGNDFAYSSHTVNFRLSKNIAPNLDANVSYGFVYSAYTHPDSVTKFTEYRVNKLHLLSAGLNYVVNDTMRLYSNLAYQHNNSNLPTGFILSSEDASTLVGIQSPSLGDYHKYSISAGVSLNF